MEPRGRIARRGTPAGIPVIQAGHSITICGSVLLDPGVTLDMITSPPAVQDCGSLAVGRDAGLDFALGRPFPGPPRRAVPLPVVLRRHAGVDPGPLHLQ